MSQLGKSTPKMRTAFTPRVKSALNIHDKYSKKSSYATDKKDQSNPSINPEKIQLQLSKKLNLNSSSSKFGKVDISNLNTDSDSPVKHNNFFLNTLKSQEPEQKVTKEKEVRRNHLWPEKAQKNHNFNQDQNFNEGKISRCMSAHTIKSTYSMKSQKSDRIKENRQQFNQKFNVALDYLITKNSEYFNEKLNMCNQKSRPKQRIFTIKRPSINTTNKDFFKKNEDKHKLYIEPQNEKVSLLLSNSKVCGNSTTHQFHKGSPQKRPEIAQWSQGFKLQGPIYQATTYSNAFPNHGDFQKMVPIAVWNEHPLGMKQIANTTHNQHFKGKFRSRSQLATWNNLNPIANDLFDTKKSTMYETQFGKKETQTTQKWPISEHKLITTQGKFNTEMRSSLTNFNTHEIHTENKCDCGRKKH